MQFDKYIDEIKVVFEDYFRYVSKIQSLDEISSSDKIGILYPNILLVTNCTGFFVTELIGAVRSFEGLVVKRHKEKSIYRYLSQFDESDAEPIFHLDGKGFNIRHLCLVQESVDFKAVEERFPNIEKYQSRLIRKGGKGSPFTFGENFESCFIEDSVLVNQENNLFRCKSILNIFITRSSITKVGLRKTLVEYLNDEVIKGVYTVENLNEENLVVGGQLQSMYLFPSLHETTIGEFLKLHPNIIKKAFNTEHFEYEPYLKWMESDGTCEDIAINPDLMIKRADGDYDIYDLKTALLKRRSLTKGARSRRRFIDYVEEGVAQLANYEEYFSYCKNREHAQSKYGISVTKPKLVLIVGSWDNASLVDIKQAQRRYKNVEIIDYDSFCHLFLATTK